jgi:hypothetical protein
VRYLTLCAEDALDVLLLEEEGIISARNGSYDDVTFAALTDEHVAETLRTIPNATGFSGDFIETVLFDPKTTQPELPASRSRDPDDAFFAALEEASDTPGGRKELNIAALREQLSAQFPFDIINLDLCGYTFKQKEDIPGRTIRALRRILELQRTSQNHDGVKYEVGEFGLLYTTRIDTRERLGSEYERLLDHGIDSNLSAYDDVRRALASRHSARGAADLRKKDPREYLRLAIPKQLAITLAAEGWEIDGNYGIELVDIERVKHGHPYSMLHMAMTLRLARTGRAREAKVSRKADSAYHETVKRLFGSDIPSAPRRVSKDVSESLERLLAKAAQRRDRTSE